MEGDGRESDGERGGFSTPISPHTPLSGSNGEGGGVSAFGGNQSSADLGHCRAGRHPAIPAALSMTILSYDSRRKKYTKFQYLCFIDMGRLGVALVVKSHSVLASL